MSKIFEKLKDESGQVYCFDLVNGIVLTTRIKSVDEEGVTCGKLLTFVPHQNPTNPGDIQVLNVPYGAPLYDHGDENFISFNHIIFASKANVEMAQAFTKSTSGLELAGAGTLENLKNIDISNLGNN